MFEQRFKPEPSKTAALMEITAPETEQASVCQTAVIKRAPLWN